MLVLRKGDRGDAVRALQNDLHGKGIRITADAIFGFKTEVAVKEFQRKHGLHSDGIVGRHTLAALGRPVTSRPPHPAIGGVAGRQAVGAMNLSASGFDFIYNHEARRNVSNVLHHPTSGSGVTLGPGYDMKSKSQNEIKNVMLSIGLSEDISDKISQASGLSKDDANTFVYNNKSLVFLSVEQEKLLFRNVVPSYVKIVKSHTFVQLKQYEFDTLVSFAYNAGNRVINVCNFLNKGSVSDAMDYMKSIVFSGGERSKGLINRRKAEVDLFLYGRY
ncbi:pesticin C-terminus-like muramidase [Candidatus Pantoea multigeneris]|uniref:Lysozyme n=1 Tax=Candidatus Pantoea multigeneris TaxID=2608357 RepID=A0ABX0R497_9GAMM|nr:pesticin C-terminus-like muramidase [Pantoea multigeneris]NIF20227.1 hypothetical protein [Pantoea multigeneris]